MANVNVDVENSTRKRYTVESSYQSFLLVIYHNQDFDAAFSSWPPDVLPFPWLSCFSKIRPRFLKSSGAIRFLSKQMGSASALYPTRSVLKRGQHTFPSDSPGNPWLPCDSPHHWLPFSTWGISSSSRSDACILLFQCVVSDQFVIDSKTGSDGSWPWRPSIAIDREGLPSWSRGKLPRSGLIGVIY